MTEEEHENENLNQALALLRKTGLRFLCVVVAPNGDLQLITQLDSNRVEITGLLEVARDAVRT
jgi:hypothetical protein